MELLELDYELKVFLRNPKTYRGPKELYDIHPTGKSPIVEVIFANGEPSLKLAESGFIIQYLLQNYDPHGLLRPTDKRDQVKADYFLHYSEGTLQPIMVSLLVNHMAKNIAPFGIKTVTSVVTKAINNAYYLTEWRIQMNFLEGVLAENGTGYFAGDRLSGADIILSFPIYENIFDNETGVREMSGEKRRLHDLYPNLAAWATMIANDATYLKVTEDSKDKVSEYVAQQLAKRGGKNKMTRL